MYRAEARQGCRRSSCASVPPGRAGRCRGLLLLKGRTKGSARRCPSPFPRPQRSEAVCRQVEPASGPEDAPSWQHGFLRALRPCRREARAEAALPQATDGAAGGLMQEPAAPSRAALDHAPPIGVITLPLPSQSGQVLPSTLPVPSQLRQVFSPDPGVPGGTASGFSVWLTAGTPFPWSSRSLTRSTEAADVCSRPSEPRGRQERQAGQGSCPASNIRRFAVTSFERPLPSDAASKS